MLLSLPVRAGPPLVAAAADLSFALTEIATDYQARTGRSVKLVFGSSGNFARQIEQGAPFALFLSADEAYVFRLAAAGHGEDRGQLYALGRLALLLPKDSPLRADAELQDLAAALRDGRLRKFAIANPEHAPYGQRAEEVLRRAGLWEALRGKLVLGENVAQAAQFATGGGAQGGLVALSLALAPPLAKSTTHVAIAAERHTPLRQRMLLLKGADAEARAFHAWLLQPAARATLARYGFTPPAE